jgi:starch synthase
LLAASEVVGFAKTGGLADVVGSLPPALARRGCQCVVILPLYRCARTGPVPVQPTDRVFSVPIAGRTVLGRLWRSRLPDSDVPVHLVENAEFYDRDDPATGRGLYQYKTSGGLRDYPDNFERFAFFCRAVLEAARLLEFWPDVLHLNDWQTGLAAVYLREVYTHYTVPGAECFQRVKTLFTIHNIAYQGVFWHWDMKTAGLNWRLFNPRQLEFHGHLNCLKAGVVFSDLISTVSPTYAREIQTPYYGCGLQGALSERRDRLCGIVNGCDYRVWDPSRDPHLPAHFDADRLAPGKPACKEALQRRLGLAVEPGAPLLGVVARLVEQKGIEIILKAAPDLLRQGAQLAVLGQGDQAYQQQLQELQRSFPGRVGLLIGFDEPLAHQIEAGADLFLMPSFYEPSGLNQLYSMHYGAPPVVRATGGLADTVVDATPEALAAGTATGFVFTPYRASDLLDAVRRGVNLYREQSDAWRGLLRAGMKADWSWDRSAAEYVRLYERLAGVGRWEEGKRGRGEEGKRGR